MRILKSHPLLKIGNSYLIDSPQPSNISYLWNFGSLLAFCLIIQIITGVTLAMHYNPSVVEAFNSIEHIMRDVNNGWLIRYLHSNTASAFFFLVYLHIGRGLYYGSYKSPRTLVWVIGTIILVVMMATAFLGYVHSPKWFNINYNIILINFFLAFITLNLLNNTNKMYIHNNNKLNFIKMFNKKSLTNLGKRKYSTVSNYNNNNNINNNISDRLKEIIEELDLSPIYSFENLNKEEIKNQIKNTTKELSGVYMIINKITKDYYIGSASTNKFHARFSNHLIYFIGSKIVKHAVKKYKLENFAFLILGIFPEVVNKENNKELIDMEDIFLKLYMPNYNILTEAGNSYGYKHTEIDRQKMKDIYSQEKRDKIDNLNKGKKLFLETIEKLRQIVLNRPSLKQEIREKRKFNCRPITLYNKDGTTYGNYLSILEAAKAINCGEKTIRRVLKTEKKLIKNQWIVKDLNK